MDRKLDWESSELGSNPLYTDGLLGVTANKAEATKLTVYKILC